MLWEWDNPEIQHWSGESWDARNEYSLAGAPEGTERSLLINLINYLHINVYIYNTYVYVYMYCIYVYVYVCVCTYVYYYIYT